MKRAFPHAVVLGITAAGCASGGQSDYYPPYAVSDDGASDDASLDVAAHDADVAEHHVFDGGDGAATGDDGATGADASGGGDAPASDDGDAPGGDDSAAG